MIVTDVFVLGEICAKFTKEVILNISKNIEQDRLDYVKNLLEVHRGACPVLINVGNGDEKICLKTSQNYSVIPSEKFMEEIHEVLGADSIIYVPERNAPQVLPSSSRA